MDQVKVALAAIKKHHFWLLCVVAVLLGLGIWWSATAALAKRIEARQGELKGTYDNVAGIPGGGSHPNQDTNQEIQKRHDELTDNVFNAWTAFYTEQKIRNRWPKELGAYFVEYVESLGPDDEIPSDFRDTYMYFIRNHFPEMIEIVEIRLPVARDENGNPKKDADGNPVKIDPFENSTGQGNFGGRGEMGAGMGGMTGMTGMGGMAGMAGMGPTGGLGGPGEGSRGGRSIAGREELVGKVDWDMGDLTRIRGNFYWTTQPTTIQVRLAQEDLWVYEALLRIIRQTNAHARSHHNAAVKEILALEIGQKAAVAFSQSRVRAGGSSSGGAMGGMGGMSGMQGMMGGGMEGPGGMSGMPGMAGGGMSGMPGMAGGEMPGGMSAAGGEEGGTQRGAATSKSPEELWKERLINYRYVDQDGMPLAVADPEPFAEFRMMPIRMLLRVDQRRISKLLVNCANSEMPVEVCRVAINPGKGGSLNLGGAGAGIGGGMTGGMSGMMGPGAMSSGARGGAFPGAFGGGGGDQLEQGGGAGFGIGQTTSAGRGQQTTYDVILDVQGIIYLFNRPDRAKLGTGSAGAAMAAGPAPERAPAAAAPAAPGAEPPTAPPSAPLAPGGAKPPTTPPAASPSAPAAETPPAGTLPAAGTPPATAPPAAPAGAAATPATQPGAGGNNP